MATRFSRVTDMGSDTKSKILVAIQETQDQTLRTVLMLMLGIVEEIGDKIDSILADEKSLREAVLNGHAANHDEHHKWIARQIVHNEDHLRHHRWLQEHMEADCGDVCEWARNKMAEEKENAASRRRIVEGWIGKIGAHSITVLLTILGLGAYAYFH